MDTRQRLAALVLLIHLVTQSRGENVTSGATVIFINDQDLPLKVEDSLSTVEKEEIIASSGNFIMIQTPRDVIESPSVINDELLSLLDHHTHNQTEPDLYDRQRRSTIVDQVTAESKTLLNSIQQLDLEGIDNLQDIIAITEYEPQKIDSEKDRRKIVQNFEVTDHETTTQSFDKIYYEVPRQRGTTRIPKYGTTESTSITSSIEKTRYLNSETYRTRPSTFYSPTENTRVKLSNTNPTVPTTSAYILPTTPPVYSRIFETQTKNHNNVVTTLSLSNFPRSSVNKTRILDRFVSFSEPLESITKKTSFSTTISPTAIFPNFQTRRSISFYSPKSAKYLSSMVKLYEETSTIPAITLTPEVSQKKRKSKKSSNLIFDGKSLESSLQGKVLSRRTLNNSNDDYKFGLLAKYDIMPRPFAFRSQEPLNVAAAQIDIKKFDHIQAFPTNPATNWNLNTVFPTLSTIARNIVNKKRRNNFLNPYTKLRTYKVPFSTYIPYTTMMPLVTSTERVRHGSVPPRRVTSRGSARYKVINKESETGVEIKNISKIKEPATSADKAAASTKLRHYKTHEQPDEGQGHSNHNQGYNKHNEGHNKHNEGHNKHNQGHNKHNQGHNKKQEQVHHHNEHGNDHQRDHQQHGIDKNNHSYKHHQGDDEGKHNHSHGKDNYGHNKRIHHHSRHEHDHKHHYHSKPEHNNKRQHSHHPKHEQDVKHHHEEGDNHNQHTHHHQDKHHHQDEQHHQDKHPHQDKREYNNKQHRGRDYENYHSHNHNFQDQLQKDNDDDKHKDNFSDHNNSPSPDRKHYKNNQDHYQDHNHDNDQHKNDSDDEEDHHHHYNHDQQYHSHDQESKNTSDQNEKHENHDDQEYEDNQDKHRNDGNHQYRHGNGGRHHKEDPDNKYRGDDHDIDRDDEENRGEFTHKHEHKHGHKKEKGGHKHEAGGGTEHEEGHHGEEDEKGDKGYESRHENEKGEKGHHEKEHHDHHYEENKGDKKKYKEEDGYHKEHHINEKGEKAAEFGEKGEHQSGHSTKGKHFIHKKDEYEKKTEFFDEFHDDGDSEKGGEFHHEHKGGKGGHHKSGHHDKGHDEEKHGKKHHHVKGHNHKEDKGHKVDEGHEDHHHHEEKHGKKGGHEEGMKWGYKKGK